MEVRRTKETIKKSLTVGLAGILFGFLAITGMTPANPSGGSLENATLMKRGVVVDGRCTEANYTDGVWNVGIDPSDTGLKSDPAIPLINAEIDIPDDEAEPCLLDE